MSVIHGKEIFTILTARGLQGTFWAYFERVLSTVCTCTYRKVPGTYKPSPPSYQPSFSVTQVWVAALHSSFLNKFLPYHNSHSQLCCEAHHFPPTLLVAPPPHYSADRWSLWVWLTLLTALHSCATETEKKTPWNVTPLPVKWVENCALQRQMWTLIFAVCATLILLHRLHSYVLSISRVHVRTWSTYSMQVFGSNE